MKTLFEILILATVGWAGKVLPLPGNIQAGPPEDISTNIVNGLDAFPGQFPYMVSIQTPNGELRCGAALIDPYWVVTVSTCIFNNPSDFNVVLGLHDMDDHENGGSPQIYELQAIYRHPDHDHDGSGHDIALLRLAYPVNPHNPFIQTIALAPDNENDYSDYNCFVCGWGARYPNGPNGGILQYHSTTFLTREQCEARTGWNTEFALCFSSETSAPCHDDWGAPVVCRQNGLTYLAGIAASVTAGCMVDFPAVYTSISFNKDWIRSIIG